MFLTVKIFNEDLIETKNILRIFPTTMGYKSHNNV